jgi:cytidylate kinase
MAVITISRHTGAGGITLGHRISMKLGYRYVDEVMIKDIAEKIGVTREAVRSFEKDGATKLMRFLDKVVKTDFVRRESANRYGTVDEKEYVHIVKAIIKELHVQKNIVIVGRGGQFILKDLPDVWRILLVDELENRIRFMMENYHLDEGKAERFVRERDRFRTNFLSFFADKSLHDDPRSYDLVINMERIGLEKAEQLVMQLIARS